MAQWVTALAAKPGHPSMTLGICVVEGGNKSLQVVL